MTAILTSRSDLISAGGSEFSLSLLSALFFVREALKANKDLSMLRTMLTRSSCLSASSSSFCIGWISSGVAQGRLEDEGARGFLEDEVV